ncbi:MAG: adenosylcobinamide-phosphate synthase CbiB [Roseburia sp.]|nr:adenosylcobinamide-phosphate synthase CbiB [Roseburia sp.]
MKYHMIAFVGGFLLDLLLGDPYGLPHPVRLIGRLISKMEMLLRKKGGQGKACDKDRAELWQGRVLALSVPVCVVTVVSVLLLAAYRLHPYAGMAVECVMTYQALAAKCLKVESMKVYRCLKRGNLQQARAAVSMIVGRDTACLDEQGIARAAIETMAENTSDGVIAPMLYLAVGGPMLGFFYKAVNTMDSMVGYKNEKYLYFGRAAAKLDDFVNFLPARISAAFMLAAAFVSGPCFSGRNAYRIYKRDRRNHASPNSAQTESVCAGALGIRLAGDASYFGRVVHKPYIGDALRAVEYEDIRRANRLMYVTAWLCEGCAYCCKWRLCRFYSTDGVQAEGGGQDGASRRRCLQESGFA